MVIRIVFRCIAQVVEIAPVYSNSSKNSWVLNRLRRMFSHFLVPGFNGIGFFQSFRPGVLSVYSMIT